MSERANPLPPVDLTNCDREPIHVLGNIQSFGFLIVTSLGGIVSRASANLPQFIGVRIEEVIGRPLSETFKADALHNIRNRMAVLRGPDAVERLFAQELVENRPPFDVAIHMAGDMIVIEAEPALEEAIEAAGLVRTLISRLDQADTLTSFIRQGARQVRAITGFDRVMVYRFDEQGSGEVVAEARTPDVDSFLGLHYPASDIPAQARQLYLRNIFRVIADVSDITVPIIPRLDPRGMALDQSLSVLRAVSPIHIEYLKNMGVEASLSISIIVDGKLWGLFACHHYSPRLPSFASRTAAELFAQMFSLMLESRERREVSEYESKARHATDRLMATVAQNGGLLSDASWLGAIIFDTIPADGVGVYLNGTTSFSGLTPDPGQFEGIVNMLNRSASSQIFATDCIQTILPEAAAHADIAAGLLAIPISRSPRDYVVLFRSEQLRSVRWAGNPEKSVEHGVHGDRLTPRKSFEAWAELVRGTSVPFTAVERRVAEALRIGMLEVLMRLADDASEERKRSHERQELLIAELNHRVRNILALIRGLISQTKDNSASIEYFIGNLEGRIQALARAHDQITNDRWSPAPLIDLIRIEAAAFLHGEQERVKLRGPNILLHPLAFTTLALVIHELITNAAKYGALSDSGTVHIDWRQDQDGSLTLEWLEKGGPAVVAPSRRGFGSTIIESSIPHDLGGNADISYRLTGIRAEFCIPSRHVAGIASQQPERRQAVPIHSDDAPLKGKTVLLVEDSMIIALDAEDALRSVGAERVLTASHNKAALSIIAREQIGFALLDVNLGEETSFPTAEALTERGIPFLFATGYGEGIFDLDGYPRNPVITKPYDVTQLCAGLNRLDIL